MNRSVVVSLGILAFLLVLTPIVLADSSTIAIPPDSHPTVLTLTLNRGDSVSYSWSGNASVTFRIQNSTGTDLVDTAGQTGSGTWQAPTSGTYTFGFRNSNQFAAQVSWTINQQGALSTTTIYFAVGLAALGVLVAAVYMMKRRKPSK